jgi:4-hydroxybenzoyl-CoA thioesterase
MPFSTRITVRFADADPAGLVYYPALFHYCHVAMEEFFAARCGVSYARVLAEERLGFPTVNVRAEFFAPLVYGDEAEVEVSVSHVGRSSATFEYAIRRAADGVVCARATLVQVAMSLDERRAVPVPEKYRESGAWGPVRNSLPPLPAARREPSDSGVRDEYARRPPPFRFLRPFLHRRPGWHIIAPSPFPPGRPLGRPPEAVSNIE